MQIKGNIGEEVYIKGKIVGAEIWEKGVSYKIHIDSFYSPADCLFNVTESEIMFNESGSNKSGEPEKRPEVKPVVKRGPGRPKKATLDSLVKKAEKFGGVDKEI